MKNTLLIVFVMVGFCCHAQTWDEWFNQKKTKKKYLLQQIVALQTYIGYAEKGYKIASEGLYTIEDIKHGEFGLHSTYFNSLKTVNPAIKNAAQVAEIIALQMAIVNHFRQAISQYRASNYFNADELGYINNVYAALADRLAKDIDALLNIITDGKLQMTDDERIAAINKLYADTQDKNAFAQSFTNGGFILAQQRQAEALGNNIIKGFCNSK